MINKLKLLNEDNHIYFDIEISGTNPYNKIGIVADYTAARTQAIVEQANKYHLAVARFEIPNFFVPVHIPLIQSNQADINLTQYSVTLEYNGDIQQVYLEYIPRTGFPAPSSPVGDLQAGTPYYFINDYQTMVDMLNNALEDAFNNLSAPPFGSARPVMIYSREDNLFKFLAQSDYYDLALATPIKVYFNFKIWVLFDGFTADDLTIKDNPTVDGRDYQILIKNEYNNLNTGAFDPVGLPWGTDSYYQLKQQNLSIQNWNPFKRILLISPDLPFEGVNIDRGGNNTLKILNDFIPYADRDIRSVWQYDPAFYRLLDLKGTGEIRKFSISFYWLDNNGNFYKIFVPYGTLLSCKLVFIDKSKYITD